MQNPAEHNLLAAQATPDRNATWLDPVQQFFILDEYPDKIMPRTVRAQVGFGALLILVQWSFDFMAWTLGLRWVFVDSLGPYAGWPLTIFFAFLIAGAIAIFERFVLTADTSKMPLMRNPAILSRLTFIIVAAFVTSIPVEMMMFNDVVQGRINGEVSLLRNDAREVYRGDVQESIKQVETAITLTEAARLEPVDKAIADVQKKILTVSDLMQSEEEGKRNGGPGKGPRYDSLRSQRKELDTVLDDMLAKREKLLAAKDAQSPQIALLVTERERLAQRLEARLTDKELSEVTQRPLNVPDGFARRWELMNELEDASPLYVQTKWAIRCVIIALGLLVFMTKLFYNDTTAQYYASAAGAQRRLGVSPALVKEPVKLGIPTDPESR